MSAPRPFVADARGSVKRMLGGRPVLLDAAALEDACVG